MLFPGQPVPGQHPCRDRGEEQVTSPTPGQTLPARGLAAPGRRCMFGARGASVAWLCSQWPPPWPSTLQARFGRGYKAYKLCLQRATLSPGASFLAPSCSSPRLGSGLRPRVLQRPRCGSPRHKGPVHPQVRELADRVRVAFTETLGELDWVDEASRKAAQEKAGGRALGHCSQHGRAAPGWGARGTPSHPL